MPHDAFAQHQDAAGLTAAIMNREGWQGVRKSTIEWNPELRLIFCDVDETVAPLYERCSTAMASALAELLRRDIAIVFVTGQSVANIEHRLISMLPADARSKCVVGPCSGAELWGYGADGVRLKRPFYSRYDESAGDSLHRRSRDLITELMDRYRLERVEPMPVPEFRRLAAGRPHMVMFEDRGAQVTIEFANILTEAELRAHAHLRSSHLEAVALRASVFHEAKSLFEPTDAALSPRLAGVFAIDFALAGVDKSVAVLAVFSGAVLDHLRLVEDVYAMPQTIEVWGDRFSSMEGTDWHMCVPLPDGTRAITFRKENVEEFDARFDIRIWDGQAALQEGLLEFLQTAAATHQESSERTASLTIHHRPPYP